MKTQLSKPARHKARYTEEYKQAVKPHNLSARTVNCRSKESWGSALLLDDRANIKLPLADDAVPLG
jgi:hypothetical protein